MQENYTEGLSVIFKPVVRVGTPMIARLFFSEFHKNVTFMVQLWQTQSLPSSVCTVQNALLVQMGLNLA